VSLVKTEMNLDKMELLAHQDQLTSLGNRVALDHFLKKAIKESKQAERFLSFLYLDLDGFKNVNDTYGHQAGDLLLQQVAHRLTNSLRSGDSVFRLGGDEFLVVLNTSQISAEKESEVVAAKLIKKLNRPFELMNTRIEIGCSIGGAIWPQHDRDPFTVMSYADEALYLSKNSGKNRYTFRPESAE
jgi:diguanylate cyclase (GGDEF)-like protein